MPFYLVLSPVGCGQKKCPQRHFVHLVKADGTCWSIKHFEPHPRLDICTICKSHYGLAHIYNPLKHKGQLVWLWHSLLPVPLSLSAYICGAWAVCTLMNGQHPFLAGRTLHCIACRDTLSSTGWAKHPGCSSMAVCHTEYMDHGAASNGWHCNSIGFSP